MLLRMMVEELDQNGRGQVFDRAYTRLGLNPLPERIAELVQHYRAHSPAIQLFEGVQPMLASLRSSYRLAVVTDGLPLMQRLKVSSLQLDAHVDAIVYSWEEEAPKPSPVAFRTSLERLSARVEDAVIIGDDVICDLGAAQQLGCPFVRVRTGRYRERVTPQVTVPVLEVDDVRAVPDALRRL
jgi:FMN phosphatase YigB (HAD superfamily)